MSEARRGELRSTGFQDAPGLASPLREAGCPLRGPTGGRPAIAGSRLLRPPHPRQSLSRRLRPPESVWRAQLGRARGPDHPNREGIRVCGLKPCGARVPQPRLTTTGAVAGEARPGTLQREGGQRHFRGHEPPPRLPPASPGQPRPPPPDLTPGRTPRFRRALPCHRATAPRVANAPAAFPPSRSAPGEPEPRALDRQRAASVQVGVRSGLGRPPRRAAPVPRGTRQHNGCRPGTAGAGAHAHQYLTSSR